MRSRRASNAAPLRASGTRPAGKAKIRAGAVDNGNAFKSGQISEGMGLRNMYASVAAD